MTGKKINGQISVAPQIRAEDLADIAQSGFRSVICNRPDGEGADQPTFEEIEAASTKFGLEARYLPIVAGKVGDDNAEAFGELLNKLPKPVLAYCRTGTRSITAWALTHGGQGMGDEVVNAAAGAGYDLSALRALL